MKNDCRGSLLVGIVFAMLLFALMAVAGVSMHVSQVNIALSVQSMAQAHAAAEGATNYVVRQLADDPDWSDGAAFGSSLLGGVPFTVTLDHATRNRVDATVESSVVYGSDTARKIYNFGVWRMPKAANYALFWDNGAGGGTTLAMTNVNILGDAYLGGSSTGAGSSISNGILYHAAGSTVLTVSMTTLVKEVTGNQPDMPAYDTGAAVNRYENAAGTYLTDIQSAHNAAADDTDMCPNVNDDLVINAANAAQVSALVFAGGTTPPVTTCRDVWIDSTVDLTITGAGKLVAWRDIRFQLPTGGDCTHNDEFYRSSDGGCKKAGGASAGTVWSGEMAGTADYTTALNYCTTTLGNGYGLPTALNLIDARQEQAAGHLSFDPLPGKLFWSSTAGASANTHKAVDMGTLGAPAVEMQDNPLPPLPSVICAKLGASTNHGTTTITPSGGRIEIIAGGNIIKSDDRKGLRVDVADLTVLGDRVTLFAANRTITGLANLLMSPNSQIFISGTTYGPIVELEQPLVIAARNLRLAWGADVLDDGVLYLRDRSDVLTERNFLDVIDAGTTVDGSVISVSRRDPSLRLQGTGADTVNRVVVDGIVYARGAAAQGKAQIENATVRGSLMVNFFSADTLSNTTVDSTNRNSYPTTNLPDGFDGSASIETGSWEGM